MILRLKMAMQRDQWTEHLLCPNCRATGSAVLSQANPESEAYHAGDENVQSEAFYGAFRLDVTDLGCQFYCVRCGVLADHIRL
jgi:hypothetical protein